MVFHFAGLGVGVVNHRAVGIHPGQAYVAVLQAVEVVEPAELDAVGGEPGFNPELFGLLGCKIVVERAYYKGESGQEDHQARQEDAPEDTLCHGFASIR